MKGGDDAGGSCECTATATPPATATAAMLTNNSFRRLTPCQIMTLIPARFPTEPYTHKSPPPARLAHVGHHACSRLVDISDKPDGRSHEHSHPHLSCTEA